MDQPTYAKDAFVTSMRGDGMRAPSPVRVRPPPSELGPLPELAAPSVSVAPPLPPPPRAHHSAGPWLPRSVTRQARACAAPARDAVAVFVVAALLLLVVRPPFVCTQRNGVTKGTLSYPRLLAYSGVAAGGALWLRRGLV